MVSATELKAGTTFLLDGRPYQVVKFSHSKIARGGATVRLSLRNLITGSLEEKTFNGTHKFDEISTTKRSMQYLFSDGEVASFIDPQTFEQVEAPSKLLEESLLYLKEGGQVSVLMWQDPEASSEPAVLSVEIPPNVVLSIKETAPGVKGNSATNVFKPAKLENGLEVKVPLFMKVGDRVRVDTRSGEYIERVSS